MVPKNIWLTGSRGFLGRREVASLKKFGAQPRCFTNQQAGEKTYDSNLSIALNYRDAEDIKRNIKEIGIPDVFIHIGWGDMDKPESSYHLTENVPAGQTLINTLFE